MQVHFLRALQRVADKVCSNRQERSVYMLLGSLIKDESNKGNVILLFKSLCGECQLHSLPENIKANLPSTALSLDVCTWKSAKSWVQWWTNPTHLSKCNNYYSIKSMCHIKHNICRNACTCIYYYE